MPDPNSQNGTPEFQALRALIEITARNKATNALYAFLTVVLVALSVLLLLGYRTFESVKADKDRFAAAASGQSPAIGSITIHPNGVVSTQDGGLIPLQPRSVPPGSPTSGETTTPQQIVNPATRPARRSKVKHSELTPEQQAQVEDNCPFGKPRLVDATNMVTTLVCRDGYVLEHNDVDKIALWVSERITDEEAQGSMERSDRFLADPLLRRGKRAELTDYRYSGYDRGHMAPAGNQNSDQRLKDETFFLSNMSPQVGALNQESWRELEKQVRDWTIREKSAYAITGGFFYDPDEDDPSKADGVIDYYTIGNGAVAVPTHFFKIVVSKDHSNPKAIAFVMENRGYRKPWKFDQYVKPIRWIEERTGIDFMPDLDPAIADPLESKAADYKGFFGLN